MSRRSWLKLAALCAINGALAGQLNSVDHPRLFLAALCWSGFTGWLFGRFVAEPRDGID